MVIPIIPRANVADDIPDSVAVGGIVTETGNVGVGVIISVGVGDSN